MNIFFIYYLKAIKKILISAILLYIITIYVLAYICVMRSKKRFPTLPSKILF